MSSRPEAVAEAGDVWEEVVKNVVLAVPHCPQQFFVGVIGKLLSSGISRAIEAEPDPSADECIYSIRCLSDVEAYPHLHAGDA